MRWPCVMVLTSLILSCVCVSIVVQCLGLRVTSPSALALLGLAADVIEVFSVACELHQNALDHSHVAVSRVAFHVITSLRW